MSGNIKLRCSTTALDRLHSKKDSWYTRCSRHYNTNYNFPLLIFEYLEDARTCVLPVWALYIRAGLPRLLMVSNKGKEKECPIINPTSRIHEHYSCIIPYISKTNYRNDEHKICYKLVLFTCSVNRRLASCGDWN